MQGMQEDAEEFLSALLNCLHQEILIVLQSSHNAGNTVSDVTSVMDGVMKMEVGEKAAASGNKDTSEGKLVSKTPTNTADATRPTVSTL